MKKFIYLCGMTLLCMNVMAQIDPYDQNNWDCVLYDEFTNNSWNTWDNWLISHPYGHYKAFIPEWPSGVSRGLSEHQVYQRENCQFNNNGLLQFVSVYEGGQDNQPLQCGDYDIPPGKICDINHPSLFYSTGKIETDVKYLYGYFEIKCSLPIHAGSFPAFWLYGGGSNYYNEIDIFEYSNGIALDNYYKQFTCGIYCDNYNTNYTSYARTQPILPETSTDLRQPHVFACEWLPDRVTWFVDGVVVNEELNRDHIPHHSMALKVNYAIDNYAVPITGSNQYQPQWFGTDVMTIEYLKILQLKTNCNSDVVITSLSDLLMMDPSVKKSIYIEPISSLAVPNNTHMTLRSVDGFEIGTGFEINAGAQMTFIVQECPN